MEKSALGDLAKTKGWTAAKTAQAAKGWTLAAEAKIQALDKDSNVAIAKSVKNQDLGAKILHKSAKAYEGLLTPKTPAEPVHHAFTEPVHSGRYYTDGPLVDSIASFIERWTYLDEWSHSSWMQ